MISTGFYPDFSTIIFEGENITQPFLGGFNKPKIQWLDWDNDNDDDLFLLDEDGKIKFFRNNGYNEENFNFVLEETAFNGFENISWFYFEDFDNDSDYDIITQNPENFSTMVYYQNIDNEFMMMNIVLTIDGMPVESDPVMTPTFADIDNDGDFDFFTGNTVGTITFYENSGYINDMPSYELITNFWQELYIVGSSFNQRHGASAISFMDLDNDTDLDLAWGDYFQQSLYIIWNEGDENFPNMDNENVFQQFPQETPVFTAGQNMPTFSDIDLDGDQDLFVTVLSGAFGYQLKNNFIYYEKQDDFIYRKSNFIETLDLLSDINPEFADIDFDGDLDLLVGTDFDPSSFPWHGSIVFFENIGLDENQEPIWSLENDNLIEIETNNLCPVLADIDFDEDLDLFVGDFNGEIHFYRNIGNKFIPDFSFEETLEDIDLSGYSTPDLVDIDNDQDLDLLIGDMSGLINFYENTGDRYIYNFELVENNYFGIDVTNRSNPEFYDYDNDNDFDLLIGSGYENIVFYKNVGNINNPNFVIDLETYMPFAGKNASPEIYYTNEIQGVAIGVSTGGFLFYPFEDYLNGDLNNDLVINIFDIIILIEFILYSFNESISTYYMDINNDSFIDISDVISIIQIIFSDFM